VFRSMPIMPCCLIALGLTLAPRLAAEDRIPVVLPLTFDVAPDGTTVAFSWRGDIWCVPIEGGAARRLTSHDAEDHSPRYSPDGREIAFISTRFPGGQVYIMPAEGGTPRQVTYHTDGFGLEGWYADGSALLVTASRDDHWRHARRFFRVDARERTAHRRLFDAEGRDGSLSPDGKRMLFVREGERWWRKGYRGERAAQIWLHDFETGTYEKLSTDRIPHEWPLWDPRGDRFYFVSEEDGTRNLWVMELATRKRQQLTRFRDDGVTFPALSADGSVIVFRRLGDLYACRPGAGEEPRRIPISYGGDALWPAVERRLVDRAEDVDFAPDGKQIAIVAGGDVFVMDREMREPRQVTDTPEPESGVRFAPDGKSLYFVSAVGGQPDIWCAVPADPEKYWWLNDAFRITRVTEDPEVEARLAFRPDGKRLAFTRKGGELWTIDPDGGHPQRVLAGWSAPRYEWSPDGKWFVYSVQDDDFNSDVWVVKADASAPPFNISRHPDFDAGPAWSPDGRTIAFVGQRTHRELDAYYVFLRREDEETSSRDRRLEKALEAMKKGAKKAAGKSGRPGAAAGDPKRRRSRGGGAEPEPGGGARPPAPGPEPDPQETEKNKARNDAGKKDRPVEVKIDFEGLPERIHRLSIPNSVEGNLVWSADSKRLVFSAVVKGERGLYAVEIPGERPTPKKLSSTVLSDARWLAGPNELTGRSGGSPAAMSASGSVKTFGFRVKQEIDRVAQRNAAFDAAWYVMRERFYDGGFNDRDWSAIRRKYRPLAAHCLGDAEFATLVNLMLGELNASHLGFSAGRRRRARGGGDGDTREWVPSTVHLGVRWDPGHPGPGLRVRDVIPRGPASLEKHRLEAGELVLAIDGRPVSPETDLTTVLNESTDHDYRLTVRDAAGRERIVTLRATTTPAARRLLYERRLKERHKRVEELSGGTLGYCHIAGMNWSSFERFEAELYALGYGKDGLVIDVRDNGGGSTTDHLLTVLCQPRHAITVPRRGGPGYPQDRRVYASWQKPIVVLCNQNSYSNAEIFTHAIKQLGRGQVVGVQTAGGVISTGGAAVLDVGFIRTPFRGWFLLDGRDMELNGARPDHVVWPAPGELPAGIDRQLDKAVEVLLADVEAWKARPKPELRYARERNKDL
jgi:tricorn protease